MDIAIEKEGQAIIATVRGRIDTISAAEFEKGLAMTINGGEKVLVLELSGLGYISSAGLRVILSTAKSFKAKGGEIRLAATSGSVKKVLQISGFLSMFKSFDTRRDALAET